MLNEDALTTWTCTKGAHTCSSDEMVKHASLVYSRRMTTAEIAGRVVELHIERSIHQNKLDIRGAPLASHTDITGQYVAISCRIKPDLPITVIIPASLTTDGPEHTGPPVKTATITGSNRFSMTGDLYGRVHYGDVATQCRVTAGCGPRATGSWALVSSCYGGLFSSHDCGYARDHTLFGIPDYERRLIGRRIEDRSHSFSPSPHGWHMSNTVLPSQPINIRPASLFGRFFPLSYTCWPLATSRLADEPPVSLCPGSNIITELSWALMQRALNHELMTARLLADQPPDDAVESDSYIANWMTCNGHGPNYDGVLVAIAHPTCVKAFEGNATDARGYNGRVITPERDDTCIHALDADFAVYESFTGELLLVSDAADKHCVRTTYHCFSKPSHTNGHSPGYATIIGTPTNVRHLFISGLLVLPTRGCMHEAPIAHQ